MTEEAFREAERLIIKLDKLKALNDATIVEILESDEFSESTMNTIEKLVTRDLVEGISAITKQIAAL